MLHIVAFFLNIYLVFSACSITLSRSFPFIQCKLFLMFLLAWTYIISFIKLTLKTSITLSCYYLIKDIMNRPQQHLCGVRSTGCQLIALSFL